MVYVLFLSPMFKVHTVQVEGANWVPSEVIKSHISLGESIWLIPKDKIVNQILEDPRIAGVSLYRGLPDGVRIVVQERIPVLVWQTGSSLYVVDESGEIFLSYPVGQLPANLQTLPMVVDTKNVPGKLGQHIVSPVFIHFVEGTSQNIQQLLPQVTADHWEIGETIYEVTLLTKQGLKVELTTLGDPGVEIRNLTRLIVQKKASLTSNVNLVVDRWAYVQ